VQQQPQGKKKKKCRLYAGCAHASYPPVATASRMLLRKALAQAHWEEFWEGQGLFVLLVYDCHCCEVSLRYSQAE
jgi:hypothetical protein